MTKKTMKTTTRMMLIGVVATLATGCIHTNSVLLDPGARYAPTYPHDVRIYLDPADVPWDYEEIAVVYGNADDDLTDEADLLEAIREEAADLGAHAVILMSLDDPSALERVADDVLHFTDAKRRARAVAIRAVERTRR